MSHRFNERVGISVALFAALAGCHRAETDPRTQPPLVRTAIAQPAEGGTREFTGVVSARVQSDLGFRVGGKVVERLVNAGEVARRLDVPHNTMSSHLGILNRAGLVRSERFSRSIVYRADLDALRSAIAFLLKDCCGGRPEICAPLLAELAPCCPPKVTTDA